MLRSAAMNNQLAAFVHSALSLIPWYRRKRERQFMENLRQRLAIQDHSREALARFTKEHNPGRRWSDRQKNQDSGLRTPDSGLRLDRVAWSAPSVRSLISGSPGRLIGKDRIYCPKCGHRDFPRSNTQMDRENACQCNRIAVSAPGAPQTVVH